MNQKLPRAIQREVEAAEAAQAALTAQQQPPAPPAPAAPPAAEPAPTPEPTPVAPPSPTPAPAQPTQAPPVPDYWEQRFRTVQGMYSAEVPRLQQQLQEAERRAKEAEDKLKTVEPPKPNAPAASPQDIESFGADLVEMVQRQATAAFGQLAAQYLNQLQQLDGRIKHIEQGLQGVAKQTELTLDQQFYMKLAASVPDWEAVNVDPRFLTWLQQADPVYGVPRQAALEAAHKRFDVEQVAAVFKAWKSTLQTQPLNGLATMEVPRADGGAPQPAPPQAKPIISSKFVEDFFNDVARGRYAGREAEAQRIEAEINSAAAEGRIR